VSFATERETRRFESQVLLLPNKRDLRYEKTVSLVFEDFDPRSSYDIGEEGVRLFNSKL
jgi:hypothetical protein